MDTAGVSSVDFSRVIHDDALNDSLFNISAPENGPLRARKSETSNGDPSSGFRTAIETATISY
jgi:hypothetical protein